MVLALWEFMVYSLCLCYIYIYVCDPTKPYVMMGTFSMSFVFFTFYLFLIWICNYFRCMLHNFAANIEMYGVLDAVGSGPVEARTSENSTMASLLIEFFTEICNQQSWHSHDIFLLILGWCWNVHGRHWTESHRLWSHVWDGISARKSWC